MPTITISDFQFNTKNKTITMCPGAMVGAFAPPKTPRSPKFALKRGASSSKSAKYSKLAVDMERIFASGKHVSALWTKDGSKVYGELPSSSTGETQQFLYDAPTRTLYTNRNSRDANIALLLYALHPNSSTMEYSREALSQMVLNMDPIVKTVGANDLGFLCDCFYYDIVDELSPYDGKLEVQPFSANEQEFIQQAVRTNSVEIVPSCLQEFLGTTFSFVPFTPAAETSAAPSASFHEFFEKAKNGDYLLGRDWNEDQESRIRPLSSLDDYIPNEAWRKMVALVHKRLNRVIDRECMGKRGLDAIKNDYINIIIGGRPGTGKTTTADALSATLGLPIYTAKVTRNTEEDTFEGMTKTDGNGKFVLHDTAFLKAYESGGIVVIEEFNLADPGVLQGAIGQAIEYPFILNRDGYQEVRRHPMCVIIATMNTGTQGAREPNQALTSRFPVTLTMDDPSEGEFLEILEKHGHKKALCKKVYKAYTSILNYLKDTANNEEMMLCVTMRHCLGALDLVDDEIVGSVREAIYDTMIGAISLRDAELAEEVWNVAVKPLPLD